MNLKVQYPYILSAAWDNTNQKRFIAINGDELTYKNPTPAPGGGGTAVVTLKRATSATE